MSSHTRWTIVCCVLLLTACATAPSPAGRPPEGPSTAPASPEPAPVSPGQAAGQRVVYSYPGAVPPDSLLATVREGRAAGVIFFAENTADPAAFRTAVDRLTEAQRQSPVDAPLLLMTDQEGGAVRRLPGEPELSARQVGESADPAGTAARTGVEAGGNLAAAGLNTNLAPVLDVYRTPGDFIDAKQRSYGRDPSAVAVLASAFAAAQRTAGVAATAKHFPGLGSAPAGSNTDTGPVTLPLPLETLRAVDEAPYPAAIAAGVPMVMLSWAVYPALDASRPAGLSPVVVGGELRQRLGFRGVTVTDALEAGALTGFGGTGERAVAAAVAGMDLLLCSARDVAQGDEAAAALARALGDGTLDPAESAAASARVAALRAGLR